MCNHDTVQIRSRHGCHSDTHSDFKFKYSMDTLHTWKPFWCPFRYSTDTLQTLRPLCYSFRGLFFRYSSNTLQTRTPFWYSFRYNSQTQYRYAPDTDATLILSQNQLSDTLQIRSRHIRHSDAHSFNLQITIQQSLLDGIYKPISNKTLSPL